MHQIRFGLISHPWWGGGGRRPWPQCIQCNHFRTCPIPNGSRVIVLTNKHTNVHYTENSTTSLRAPSISCRFCDNQRRIINQSINQAVSQSVSQIKSNQSINQSITLLASLQPANITDINNSNKQSKTNNMHMYRYVLWKVGLSLKWNS